MQDSTSVKNYGGIVEKNDALRVRSNLVQIAIVLGTRETASAADALGVVTTYRKYFFLRRRWELKDVIVKGLPQNMRFLVLRDYEQFETDQAGLFVLFCSKS